MPYNMILAIDPSGNFEEGKGTTGYIVLDPSKGIREQGTLRAKDYDTNIEYWAAHSTLIYEVLMSYKNCVVVIEDFILYPHKAKAQSYSKLETCRLLGAIQVFCFSKGIPLEFQRAVDVKTKWSDEKLIKKKLLRNKNKRNYIKCCGAWTSVPVHVRDAYRHALHYNTFKSKDKSKPVIKKIKEFMNYE